VKTGTLKPGSVLKRIAYVYLGTSDFEADRDFYLNVLGARKVWEFKEFGARVAAFDLCGEPYLLIADHVRAPSKRLIFEVDDIRDASRTLEERGWRSDGERFEVPDGPCINFEDRSGNEYAILEMRRPRILERAR
jgi:catechol 2,3-dioxygenase-like lactoylglutathione lyase family enzyme